MSPVEPTASSSPDATRRFARRLALIFFFAWLVVLLADADRPPPPGFLLIVLLDAIAAGGVLYRVPHYLDWQSTRRPRRLLRVLGDGAMVGVVFALVPLVLGSGEPSVTPTVLDRFTWFAVLVVVGIANAMLLYACVAANRLRGRRCP